MINLILGKGLGLFGNQQLSSQQTFNNHAGPLSVNLSNGNVVNQRRDMLTMGQGIDIDFVQTYNSLGRMRGQTDNFTHSFEERLRIAKSTLNQPDSVIERVSGDGFVQSFTYENGVYTSTEGSGAHDTLVQSQDGTWVWTEGSTQEKRFYESDGTNQWRMHQIEDREGFRLTLYFQNDGQLERVMDSAEQEVVFYYDDKGRLSSIYQQNPYLADEITRTHYEYDSQDRLSVVRVDLTPDDHSIEDGKVFAINYYYDGDSERIHQLVQSDGQSWTLRYDGQGRVTRVEHGTGSEQSVMEFTYSNSSNETHVYTYISQTQRVLSHVYYWDSEDRLTRHLGPADENRHRLTTDYQYNDQNQVTRVENNLGGYQSFEYDLNGNLKAKTTELGIRHEYEYDEHNSVVEQSEIAADGISRTKHFVYDQKQRLRFEIDLDGVVYETVYDDAMPLLQKVTTRSYSQKFNRTASDLASVESWANANQGTRQNKRETILDFRGQVSQVVEFERAHAVNGAAVAQRRTSYVYDASGNLLSRVSPATDKLPASSEHFVYDGLGRQISFTDALGGISTTDWQGNSLVTRNQSGLTTIVSFDSRGLTLSEVKQDAFDADKALSSTRYYYDQQGRIKAQEDASGITHFLYSDRYGLLAKVNALGEIERYVYDGQNRLLQTHQLGSAIELSGLLSDYRSETFRDNAKYLEDENIFVLDFEKDRSSYRLLNGKGQAIYEVDADGYVTMFHYDGFNRLFAQEAFAKSFYETNSSEDVSDYFEVRDFVNDEISQGADSRISRTYYDAKDRVVGLLDAEGYLTTYHYNSQGQRYAEKRVAEQKQEIASRSKAEQRYVYLEQSIHYFDPSLNQVDPNDQIYLSYFDEQGREVTKIELTMTVDGQGNEATIGYVTHLYYDERGNLSTEASLAKTFDFSGHYQLVLDFADWMAGNVDSVADMFDQATATVLKLDRDSVSDDDYVINYQYDENNRLIKKSESNGLEESYHYDARNQLSEIIRSSKNDEQRVEQYAFNALGLEKKQLAGQRVIDTANQNAVSFQNQVENGIGAAREYDNQGRLLKELDAKGNATLYFYDALGRLGFKVDALGYATQYRYSRFNERTYIREFANAMDLSAVSTAQTAAEIESLVQYSTQDRETQKTFNRRGLLKSAGTAQSISQGIDELIRHEYNAFGDNVLTRELKPGTNGDPDEDLITQKIVDGRGLVTEQIRYGSLDSSEFRTSSAVYDAFGRTVQEITEQGGTNIYGYDGRNLLLYKSGDHLSNESYHYDAFGRVLSVTDALGETTHYEYDFETNRSVITTAEGIQLVTETNAFGQVIKTISGEGAVTSTFYDSAGRVFKTIGGGVQTVKTYDDNHNLTVETVGVESTRYHYNALNQLWRKEEDRNGETIYTNYYWNGFGERIQSDVNGQGAISYAYDESGNETVQITNPNGEIVAVNSSQRLAFETAFFDQEEAKYLDFFNVQGHRVEQGLDEDGNAFERVYDSQDQILGTHYFFSASDSVWKTQGTVVVANGELKRNQPVGSWGVGGTYPLPVETNRRVDFSFSSTQTYQMFGLNREGYQALESENLEFAFSVDSEDKIFLHAGGKPILDTQITHQLGNRYRFKIDSNRIHYQVMEVGSERFRNIRTVRMASGSDDKFYLQSLLYTDGASASNVQIQTMSRTVESFYDSGLIEKTISESTGESTDPDLFETLPDEGWRGHDSVEVADGSLMRTKEGISWDVSAINSTPISAIRRLDFQFSSPQTSQMFGLSRQFSEGGGYRALDYAFYVTTNHSIMIYEKGSNKHLDQLKHHPENQYRFKLDGNVMHYQIKLNGTEAFTTIYSSTQAIGDNDRFYTQAVLAQEGARISNIKFQLDRPSESSDETTVSGWFESLADENWRSQTGVEVSDKSLLQTNQGTSWDVSAINTTPIRTDRRVDFQFSSSGTAQMFGLGRQFSEGGNFRSLNYAFYVASNHGLMIYENGGRVHLDQSKHHPENQYRFMLDGDVMHYQVKFYGNDDFTTIYTSTKAIQVNDRFYAQAVLAQEGARVSNVQVQVDRRSKQWVKADGYRVEQLYASDGRLSGARFYETLSDGGWTTEGNVVITNGELTSKESGIDWGVSATHGMVVGTNRAVDFSFTSTRKAQFMGLTRDLAQETSIQSLDYAFYAHRNDRIHLYADGKHLLDTQITHKVGNRYRLKIVSNAVLYQVKVAGSNEFTTVHSVNRSADTEDNFYLKSILRDTGARIANIQVQTNSRALHQFDASGNLTEHLYDKLGQRVGERRFNLLANDGWVASENIIITNGELTREEGNSWDQAATHSTPMSSGQRIDFSFTSTNKTQMLGLKNIGNTNSRFEDISYGIQVDSYSNHIHIWEEGDDPENFLFIHKPDYRYRIWIDGQKVHYQVKKESGSSEFVTFYTSERKVNENDQFYIQASLYDQGASVSNIQLQSIAQSTHSLGKDGNESDVTYDEFGSIVKTELFDSIADDAWLTKGEVEIRNGEILRTQGGWGNVGVATRQTFGTNNYIDFSFSSIGKFQYMGLNREEFDDTSRVKLDYAFNVNTRNELEIQERGGRQKNLAIKHDVGNKYRFWLDGDKLHYQVRLTNSSEFVTVFTSSQPVGIDDQFHIQADIYQVGASIAGIRVGKIDNDRIITTSHYDAANRLVSVTKGFEGQADDYRQVTRYNVFGDVISTTEGVENQRQEHFSYNQYGQLIQYQDKSGINYSYLYGANGKVALEFRSIDYAKYSVTEYEYSANHKLTRVIEHERIVGPVSTHASLDAWRSALRPQGTAKGISTRYLYDKDGRVRFEVSGDGRVEETLYNKDNQIIERIEHAQHLPNVPPRMYLNYQKKRFFEILFDQSGITFASAKLTLSHQDGTTSYQFDLSNRGTTSPFVEGEYSAELELMDDAGELIGKYLGEFVYEDGQFPFDMVTGSIPLAMYSWSDLDSISRHLANADQSDNPDTGNDEVSRRSYTVYDGAGRVRGEIDANGFVSEVQYDVNGRVYSSIRYGEAIVNYTGDDSSNWRPKPSPEDYRIFNIRDSLGQIKYQVELAGHYQESKSLFARVSKFEYNDFRQKIAEHRYDDYLVDQNRDQWLDLLARLEEHDLSIAELEYLMQKRINKERSLVKTWQYDQANRLVASKDERGLYTTLKLDALGQTVSQTRTARDGEIRQQLNRYNEHGELIQTVNGETVFNANIHLNNWQDEGSHQKFDRFGRLIETSNENGEKTWYFYDDQRNRASHVMNAMGEITVMEYNAHDQKTKEIRVATRFTGDLSSVEGGNPAILLQTIAANPDDAIEEIYYFDSNGELERKGGREFNEFYYYNNFGELESTSKFARSGYASSIHRLTSSFEYDNLGQVTLEITKGSNVRRSYNAQGRVDTIDWGLGSSSLYVHSGFGGVRMEFNGVGAGEMSIQDREFDALGRIRREGVIGTDSFTRYEYDWQSNSETRISPTGIRTVERKNDFGEVVSRTDASGKIIERMAYDRSGRLISETDANGFAETRHYDALGQIKEVVNKNGHIAEYHYDAVGRLLKEIVDPGAGRLNLTTEYEWNELGQKVAVINANDVRTEYQYNANGYVIRELVDVGGLNLLTRYTLDQFGNKLEVKKGQFRWGREIFERVVAYEYDKNNHIIKKTIDPENLKIVTQYHHDLKSGLKLSSIDALGYKTFFVYDGLGREKFRFEPVGNKDSIYRHRIVENVYDQLGNKVAIKEYSKTLKLTSERLAGNKLEINDVFTLVAGLKEESPATTHYVFDTESRLAFVIDAEGGITEHFYNHQHLRIKTRRYRQPFDFNTSAHYQTLKLELAQEGLYQTPDNQETRFIYDAAGRRTHVIDANGYVEKSVYDRAGNVIEIINYFDKLNSNESIDSLVEMSALDRHQFNHFDAANRLIYGIDSGGFVTGYQRDGLGNAIGEIRYANGLNGSQTIDNLVINSVHDRRSIKRYDGNNQLILEIDSAGYATEYKRNTLGQVTENAHYVKPLAVLPENPDARIDIPRSTMERRTYYLYDSAGREVATRNSLYYVVEKNYDAAGNVIKKTYYSRTQSDFSIDEKNQLPDWRTDPLDRVESFQYDSAGRMTRQYQGEALNTVPSKHLVYDAFGNITEQYDYLGHAILAQYNQRGQKIREVKQHGHSEVYADLRIGYMTKYDYDGLGNLTSELRYKNEVELDNVVISPWGDPIPLSIESIKPRANQDVKTGDRLYRYHYDKLNRQTEIVLPSVKLKANGEEDPITIKTIYNAFGEIDRRIEAAGTTEERVTKYEYDIRGQKLAQHEAYGTLDQATTRYEYTSFGEIKKVTDPRAGQYLTRNGDFERRFRAIHGFAERAENLTAAEKIQLTRLFSVDYDYDKLGNQIIETTPSWQVNDDLVETRDKSERKFDYDRFGNITKTTDAVGGETYYLRDSTGQVRAEIDALGFLTEYDYDVNGNVTLTRKYVTPLEAGTYHSGLTYQDLYRWKKRDSEKDLEVEYIYDALGQVERKIYHQEVKKDPSRLEYVTQFETFKYDAMGNLTEFTNKLGGVFNYTYDALGRKITETTPTATYARNITEGSSTIFEGRVTHRFEYDSLNNLTKEVRAASYTDGSRTIPGLDQSRTKTYVYNKLGQLIEEHRLNVDYVVHRHLTKGGVRDSKTETISKFYDYDAHGNRISETDEKRKTTYYAYNAQNQLSFVLDKKGYLQHYSYDAKGNIVHEVKYAEKQSLGSSSALWYQRVKLSDDDRIQFHDYDLNGNRIRTATPNVIGFTLSRGVYQEAVTTEMAYNHQNKVTSIKDGNGNLSHIFYDAVGNEVLTIDPEFAVTRKFYDWGSGLVSRQVKYANKLETTALRADVINGNVEALFAAFDSTNDDNLLHEDDRETLYSYDKQGKLLETTLKTQLYHKQGYLNLTYDNSDYDHIVSREVFDSNLQAKVTHHADGTQSFEKVDDLGRLVEQASNEFEVHEANGKHQEIVRYFYNVHGEIVETVKVDSIAGRDRIVRFERDNRGNILTEYTAGMDRIEYQYDILGNKISKTEVIAQYGRLNDRYAWDGSYKRHTQFFMYDELSQNIQSSLATDYAISDYKTYNAFGEVESEGKIEYLRESEDRGGYSTGIVKAKVEQFGRTYNQLGRIVKTNEGDGVNRIYLYDNNGNRTFNLSGSKRDIDSVDTKSVSSINSIDLEKYRIDMTGYDANGNAIHQLASPLSISEIIANRNNQTKLEHYTEAARNHIGLGQYNGKFRFQSTLYNAFDEKESQRDFRGNNTRYVHDHRGLLIKTILPTISVMENFDQFDWFNPFRERNRTAEKITYYDAMGRLLGERNENGVLGNIHVYTDGRLVTSDLSRFKYNIMGEVVQETKNVTIAGNRNLVMNYFYDKNGHRSQIRKTLTNDSVDFNISDDFYHRVSYLDLYQHDYRGKLLAHSSTNYGAEFYEYDNYGRVTAYKDFFGLETSYDYQLDFVAVGDQYEVELTKTITNPYDYARTEKYDFYNRKIETNNNDNNPAYRVDYIYTAWGELKHEMHNGNWPRPVNYVYYDNGWLKSQEDKANGRNMSFEYDNNGNRVLERFWVEKDGTTKEYQNTVAVYNNRNMIESLSDTSRFAISYKYDKAGNHTYIKNSDDEFVYSYDTKNRIEGVYAADLDIREFVKIKSYQYNLLGQRTSATKLEDRTKVEDNLYDVLRVKQLIERYHYNVHGQVDAVKINKSDRAYYNGQVRDLYNPFSSSPAFEYHNFKNYDASGRNLLREQTFERSQKTDGRGGLVYSSGLKQRKDVTHQYYSSHGRLEFTNNNIVDSLYGTDNFETIQYGYSEDVLWGTVSTGFKESHASKKKVRLENTYTYSNYNERKRRTETVRIGSDRESLGTYEFDNMGNIIGFEEKHVAGVKESFEKQNNEYVLRNDGTIAYRKIERRKYDKDTEGWTDLNKETERYFYYFNGIAVGDKGTGENSTRDYGAELAGLYSGNRQNFNYLEKTINSAMIGGGSNQYTVQQGDDLPSIALRLWGDSSLWYLIADANGLTGNEILRQDQRLTIPNTFTGANNNTKTFRPYDAQNALGDTAVSAPQAFPPPPKDNKCVFVAAVVASVLIAVAAAAISIVSFGSLAPAVGPLAAVAIGAVIGAAVAAGANAATQGVMIAADLQEGWDWGSFASATAVGAIGGAVSGGIGSALHGAKGISDGVRFGINIAKTAALSIVNEAVSVGVRGLTYGLTGQKTDYSNMKFDWKNVWSSAAAGAVSSVGGAAFGDVDQSKMKLLDRVAFNAVTSLTSSYVEESILSKIDSRRFKIVNVVKNSITDIASNLIGQSILSQSHRLAGERNQNKLNVLSANGNPKYLRNLRVSDEDMELSVEWNAFDLDLSIEPSMSDQLEQISNEDFSAWLDHALGPVQYEVAAEDNFVNVTKENLMARGELPSREKVRAEMEYLRQTNGMDSYALREHQTLQLGTGASRLYSTERSMLAKQAGQLVAQESEARYLAREAKMQQDFIKSQEESAYQSARIAEARLAEEDYFVQSNIDGTVTFDPSVVAYRDDPISRAHYAWQGQQTRTNDIEGHLGYLRSHEFYDEKYRSEGLERFWDAGGKYVVIGGVGLAAAALTLPTGGSSWAAAAAATSWIFGTASSVSSIGIGVAGLTTNSAYGYDSTRNSHMHKAMDKLSAVTDVRALSIAGATMAVTGDIDKSLSFGSDASALLTAKDLVSSGIKVIPAIARRVSAGNLGQLGSFANRLQLPFERVPVPVGKVESLSGLPPHRLRSALKPKVQSKNGPIFMGTKKRIPQTHTNELLRRWSNNGQVSLEPDGKLHLAVYGPGQSPNIKDHRPFSPDHIYPKTYIERRPGFERLKPEHQRALILDSEGRLGNFSPLSKSANSSKMDKFGSSYVPDQYDIQYKQPKIWETYKGMSVNPGLSDALGEAQMQIRSRLDKEILRYLNSY